MALTLQEKFEKAVKHINNLPPKGEYSPSNNERLQFYALFKQATVGPVKGKRPGMTSFVARAKWDAWNGVKKLSKQQAMEKYLTVFLKTAVKIKDPESKRVIAELTGKGAGPKAAGAAGGEAVQLYGNALSQPSRSVVWLCLLANIPFDFHSVDLGAGEQLKPAYGKICVDVLVSNPMRKVPFMKHGDFGVFESASILRYLSDNCAVDDSWYPREQQKRSKVDMYLDWHHTNTRAGCAGFLFSTWLLPMRGKPVDEYARDKSERTIAASFKTICDVFLASSPFLAGDRPTIADLLAYQEIVQLAVVNHGYRASGKYPQLNSWMDRMEQLSHLLQVNGVLNKVAANAVSRSRL